MELDVQQQTPRIVAELAREHLTFLMGQLCFLSDHEQWRSEIVFWLLVLVIWSCGAMLSPAHV